MSHFDYTNPTKKLKFLSFHNSITHLIELEFTHAKPNMCKNYLGI